MGCLSSTSVTEIVNEEEDVQNQSICIVESELGGLAGSGRSNDRQKVRDGWWNVCAPFSSGAVVLRAFKNRPTQNKTAIGLVSIFFGIHLRGQRNFLNSLDRIFGN